VWQAYVFEFARCDLREHHVIVRVPLPPIIENINVVPILMRSAHLTACQLPTIFVVKAGSKSSSIFAAGAPSRF
jgi:hypothetical protein